MSTFDQRSKRPARLASKKRNVPTSSTTSSLKNKFLSSACLPYVLRYLSLSEANVVSQSCVEAERVWRNFQDFWAERVLSVFTSSLTPFLPLTDQQSTPQICGSQSLIFSLPEEPLSLDSLLLPSQQSFIPSTLDAMHELEVSSLKQLLIQKSACEQILLQANFPIDFIEEIDTIFRLPTLPTPVLLQESNHFQDLGDSIYREYLIHFKQMKLYEQEKQEEEDEGVTALEHYCLQRGALHCKFVEMCLAHQKTPDGLLQQYHKYYNAYVASSLQIIEEKLSEEDSLRLLKQLMHIWRTCVIEPSVGKIHKAVLKQIALLRQNPARIEEKQPLLENIRVILQSDLETCLDEHSVILQSHAHLDLQETCLISFATDFFAQTTVYYGKLAEREPFHTVVDLICTDVDTIETVLPVQLRYQFVQNAASFLRKGLQYQYSISKFPENFFISLLSHAQLQELQNKLTYLKLDIYIPQLGKSESFDKSVISCSNTLCQFQSKIEILDFKSNLAQKKWKKQFL